MTAADRARRTAEADALCAAAYDEAGCPDTGVALVAVGGYGRGELAPYSDLDLVLVLDSGVEAGEWAGQLWYPLWDSGTSIDHAVRTLEEVQKQAAGDLRVAMGLLDVRHLAGDPNLTLRLRTAVLTQWRRDARTRLEELHTLVSERGRRTGELAHAAVPDLKESVGGLRDATVLKALVASWLVDVPPDVERCRTGLLDVRDALHEVAGRGTDRVAPEYWPEIASTLGLPDAAAAQARTRSLARRLTHLSRVTWRRAEAVQRRPEPTGVRRPRLDPVAPGVAVSREEVVLDRGARPATDPLLLLRVAAEAAERRLVLSPATAARLARDAPDLPEPWPAAARQLFVRLLASGPGLLPVWETLEETGALERLLPEWSRVSLLPHASTVHRFTVDRHLVETCVEARRLVRRVGRPDLLLVAALLHDIGKGTAQDHSVVGAPMAREIAARMGFSAGDAETIGTLVRWHLLLPGTATSRDLDDPATVEQVAQRLPDPETLELLHALTEADARATSEQAWTRWRSGLVHELVRRVDPVLRHDEPPEPGRPPLADPALSRAREGRVQVAVEAVEDDSRVVVAAPDRLGLLADVAAVLARQRAAVRAAHAWTEDGVGVSVWEIGGAAPDPAVLRQRLEAGPGEVHPVSGAPELEPVVVVRHGASRSATVLEVRADDRPWLLHTVCAALAALGIAVRSAHVDTLGPQAVDVFYVQEPDGAQLGTERCAEAVQAVHSALGPTGTTA